MMRIEKALWADLAASRALSVHGSSSPATVRPWRCCHADTVLHLQGTPVLTQDAVEGPAAARFAGVLARIRRRLAPLLSPPDFDAARVLAWHGASAGLHGLPQ